MSRTNFAENKVGNPPMCSKRFFCGCRKDNPNLDRNVLFCFKNFGEGQKYDILQKAALTGLGSANLLSKGWEEEIAFVLENVWGVCQSANEKGGKDGFARWENYFWPKCTDFSRETVGGYFVISIRRRVAPKWDFLVHYYTC